MTTNLFGDILSDEAAQDYLVDMDYCVDFAQNNRNLMMHRIQYAFQQVAPEAEFEEPINIAHNYAAMENHYNRNVMVHRKGATHARKGELGIIPGSQGTHSYIVRGLGNEESFNSCSHGAGRLMGRKQAKRILDLKKEQELLKDVIHSVRNIDDLDEAPSAYKDIHKVMDKNGLH